MPRYYAPLRDIRFTTDTANAEFIFGGVSALALMTAEGDARRGLKPLAKIVGHAAMCNIARHPASVSPNSRIALLLLCKEPASM
jgi:hypothetical protein